MVLMQLCHSHVHVHSLCPAWALHMHLSSNWSCAKTHYGVFFPQRAERAAAAGGSWANRAILCLNWGIYFNSPLVDGCAFAYGGGAEGFSQSQQCSGR